MNPVPWLYRNVINPWQTEHEIRIACKFLDRMRKGMSEELQATLFRVDYERDWK